MAVLLETGKSAGGLFAIPMFLHGDAGPHPGLAATVQC